MPYVYAIIQGYFEDRTPTYVFSSKEQAEEICKLLHAADVEPIELDPDMEARKSTTVWLKHDGELYCASEFGYSWLSEDYKEPYIFGPSLFGLHRVFKSEEPCSRLRFVSQGHDETKARWEAVKFRDLLVSLGFWSRDAEGKESWSEPSVIRDWLKRTNALEDIYNAD